MTKAVRTVLVLGMLALGGCISGAKPPDTYTDSTGKTTLIETDRETCIRSCNEAYSRCMETEPAQNNSGLRQDPSMFGAKADCRNDLQSCLPPCNGD